MILLLASLSSLLNEVAHEIRAWFRTRTLHGAELRSDEYARALFRIAFLVAAFSADVLPGPANQRAVELDLVLLMRLLHAGGAQIVQHHFDESAVVGSAHLARLQRVDELIVFIHAKTPVR